MQYGMYFDNTVKKETVGEYGNQIIRILSCEQDQETIRHALSTLKEGIAAGKFEVSNCHLEGDREHSHYYEDD